MFSNQIYLSQPNILCLVLNDSCHKFLLHLILNLGSHQNKESWNKKQVWFPQLEIYVRKKKTKISCNSKNKAATNTRFKILILLYIP